MRVSVFGLGYVGCVTAACLAKAGHEVVGIDANPEKVSMVNAGRAPVIEPGLTDVMSSVVESGKLKASGEGAEAIRKTDLAMICVGTPSRSNGQLDVDALERVAQEIGYALRQRREPFTIVLRSTVLPGTVEGVLVPALLAEAGADAERHLRVAVNPEFMREGSSLNDFDHPPFTLVGSASQEAVSALRVLYAGVTAPLIHTDIKTAEMVKYVTNSFHALKVCFANEIGDLCAALGTNAHEVMRIFMMDRKLNISEAYLRPGFAFGGSCLPKDLRALEYAARAHDVAVPLLSMILPSNERQIRRGVDAVLGTRKRRIGVVGLSFKPGTDDLRESPMVTLVEVLIGKGCDVRILDRNVAIAALVGANRKFIQEEIPHISSLMCDDVAKLLEHAEVVVVGNADKDSADVLRAATPRHIIIDLTRGGGRSEDISDVSKKS